VAQAGTARSRARRAAQAASVRELHARLARERSGEILEAYRRGTDPGQIARDLGLQHQAVKALIGELRTNADRAARARVLQRVEQPRFTDAEIRRGVSLVATRVGSIPTCAEYDRAARELGLASLATIYARFRSWGRVLRAAGFDVPPRTVRSQAPASAPPHPSANGRHGSAEWPGPVEFAATSRLAGDAGPRRLPSLLGARTLRYLSEHPGSSGRAVGRGLGIRHDSQTSALLHRFERDGLVTKQPNGIASAWALTELGHQFLRDLPKGVYV